MDSTSLTKPVDLQGLSLALAKTKADYEAQIDEVGVQSDWEIGDGNSFSYILNKPAIRAGDGEGSIVEGINTLPNDAAIYTIYVSKEYGNNDTFTYTTEDTLPTASNLKNYGIWYDSTQTQSYFSILNIDTTNQTITVSSTYASAPVSDREIKIYYKYSFAKGKNSHTEGSSTIAIGANSHAEGSGCQAIYGHAEGSGTKALQTASHAEGYRTIAKNTYSHAEGQNTQANGWASHAEGRYTIANGRFQHVQGKYNIEDVSENDGLYAHIVGNGTAENARSNAHTLDWNGNAWYAGKVSAGTVANPANPTAANDLVTKAYVDANTGAATLSALTDTTISSASNGQILTYNGTNSKWENTNLPSDVFVITVTSTTENDVTTYSADKTFAEITAAHTAGKGCIVVNSNAIYTLMYISSSLCRFVSTNYIGVKRLSYKTITINSDDTVEITDSPFFSYEGSNNAYSLKTLIAQVNGKANTTSITGSLDYSSTAYRAYNTGDLFWLSNTVLAKATTSIASGATLTLNTNYVKTTIEDELKARANTSDVLIKTNTTSYTPTGDYNPATKKYVDDLISGFSTTLSGLTDTTISSPSDGQVLKYDNTSSKWINSTISTSTTVSDLTDTTIISVANGDVLIYDSTSSKWINSNLTTIVNTAVATALAEYGDGDTASYGIADGNEVSY